MKLAVNVDHYATLREARRSTEPEPVLAALLAEQAGAEGIVCHIRSDRRHITERDLRLLRGTIKTRLNVEMAATDEMKAIALEIKPHVVSLVPERPEELTTEGGLDVITHQKHLGPHIQELQDAGIRVSIFVDMDTEQISACHKLGVDMIEINTGPYADAESEAEQSRALENIIRSARHGADLGLLVHAGHGLDYHNIQPIVEIEEIEELSIGFSIVARSAIVGIDLAVQEMVALIS
ncbi:MAG: pyridoxine 5'-phosphate synthase [Candidatus Aminicenantaceae bacterium]